MTSSGLKRFFKTHPTPAYIYDRRVIRVRYKSLADSLPRGVRILYAVKANPHKNILKLFCSLGAGFDVASGGELKSVLACGAHPAKISFAGPGKTCDEISLAISKGIGILQVESLGELAAVETIARRLGRRPRIGIRVNPAGHVQGGVTMGGGPKPFGLDEEQLPVFFQQLRRLKAVDFAGVHIYAASQILDAGIVVRQMRHALRIAERVQKLFGKPLEIVNLGGGFGIPYSDFEKPLNMKRLKGGLRSLFKRDAASRFPRARFEVESGRFLVGEAGVYCTQVLYRKVSRGRTFLIVDGGMNHHLAAAGLLGSVIRRNYSMKLLTSGRTGRKECVDISGPLCTPLDLIARNVRLPASKPGDILVILNSGAYGLTASPQKFLSHEPPGEYVV